MGMTREEQLDAVVRNYRNWPESNDAKLALWRVDPKTFDGSVKFLREPQRVLDAFGDVCALFSRSQVEQRKAELQNKPSWNDAPDGAKILAYVPPLSEWIFASFSDAYLKDHGWVGIGDGEWFIDLAVQGEVIGDWRETLEKRPQPEVTPEEEEAFNMLEAQNGECIGGSLTDEGSKLSDEGADRVKTLAQGVIADKSVSSDYVLSDAKKAELENEKVCSVECVVDASEEFRNGDKLEFLTRHGWRKGYYVGKIHGHPSECEHGVYIDKIGLSVVTANDMRKPIESDRERWLDQAISAAKINGNIAIIEALMRVYDAGLGCLPEDK